MAREIRKGRPGSRFEDYYRKMESQRENRGMVILFGVLLTLTGILVSLPPVLSGFFLWIPGLALIASQVRSVARALDGGERRAKRAAAFFRKKKGGTTP